MTDPAILVAVISAASGVLVGLFGMIGAIYAGRRDKRELLDQIAYVRNDTRNTRSQVENTHDTNLREDLDGMRRAVARIEDGLQEVRSDVGKLHKDVRQIRADMRDADSDDEEVHRSIFDRLAQLAQSITPGNKD